jgi:cytochrome c-type protein NapB
MKLSTFIVLTLVTFVVGLAGQASAEVNSLRGAEAIPTTVSAPKLMKFIKDKENVDRTFEEQPPVVPHENEKYAINLKENKCLECHIKQEGKDEAKSVEMSESHFIDRAGNKLGKPAGSRYFCTQCHVPQVDLPPLVGTSFQAAK